MEGTASLWMDGKIFRVEKRTRGSTALKQCLTEDLILFSNLREKLPIQGKFEVYRTFVRDKFWKRLEPSQFVKNSPINDGLSITVFAQNYSNAFEFLLEQTF